MRTVIVLSKDVIDMLTIVRRIQDLDFSQLMQIYIEGNEENGQLQYPHLSADQQILMAEQDFYNYLSAVFFKTPGSFYALWAFDGRYQSALRVEPYLDGYLLAALETRPEARRNGYACMLINATCAFLAERGVSKLYSHVGKRNIPSLRTHERCKFTAVLDYAVYVDGSVTHNSLTFCREL